MSVKDEGDFYVGKRPIRAKPKWATRYVFRDQIGNRSADLETANAVIAERSRMISADITPLPGIKFRGEASGRYRVDLRPVGDPRIRLQLLTPDSHGHGALDRYIRECAEELSDEFQVDAERLHDAATNLYSDFLGEQALHLQLPPEIVELESDQTASFDVLMLPQTAGFAAFAVEAVQADTGKRLGVSDIVLASVVPTLQPNRFFIGTGEPAEPWNRTTEGVHSTGVLEPLRSGIVFGVDQSKSMAEQDVPGHNRWHPNIPIAVEVDPGSEFRVECRDWADAQVRNDDSSDDVRSLDLDRSHMLSGPIGVKGAQPGDLLVIDILDLGPVPQQVGPAPGEGWGYTGVLPRDNGGGLLTDYFPDAYKAIWDFHGQQATSRHIPGVRYTGIAHPGVLGTAPSSALLARWNLREQELIARDPARIPPMALPPNENNVLAGTIGVGTREFNVVASKGASTLPARENGGNHNIKNFSRGSRIFLPVHVPGAKVSVGDLHFSQGDGGITFCGAVEMGGFIDLGADLIQDGMERYGVTTNPVFLPGSADPAYSEFIAFSGVSVDHDVNRQEYMDSTLAYRNACLNAIEYLRKFGYTGEQAYLLLGSAPIEGRMSAVVDIPNACCTVYLPTAIFDFDIRPSESSPVEAGAHP